MDFPAHKSPLFFNSPLEQSHQQPPHMPEPVAKIPAPILRRLKLAGGHHHLLATGPKYVAQRLQ
jgi:hypothetical protein